MTVSTPSITVRRRTPADIAALGKLLEKQRLVTGYPEIWPLPCPIPDFIERDNELTAWVAEIGDEIVGHIAMSAVVDGEKGQSGSTLGLGSMWAEAYGTTADRLRCIGVLFTDAARAGAGIGSHLLKAAVAGAREQDAYPVLDCIKYKTHVVEFYLRRGWTVIGETPAPWSAHERIDVVLMILPEYIGKW
jgi:GNAT superfamily N-acetyltransferase